MSVLFECFMAVRQDSESERTRNDFLGDFFMISRANSSAVASAEYIDASG